MFNYGDIIEYVDGTYNENFNNARKWANSNRATFNELIDRRKEIDGVLHRFYEIKEIIVPEPTAEELQAQVRAVRNSYLEKFVDPKQLVLVWDGLSEDERQLYADYRIYLLDYTELENWYLQNPKTLEEWKNSAKLVKEVEETETTGTIL